MWKQICCTLYFLTKKKFLLPSQNPSLDDIPCHYLIVLPDPDPWDLFFHLFTPLPLTEYQKCLPKYCDIYDIFYCVFLVHPHFQSLYSIQDTWSSFFLLSMFFQAGEMYIMIIANCTGLMLVVPGRLSRIVYPGIWPMFAVPISGYISRPPAL